MFQKIISNVGISGSGFFQANFYYIFSKELHITKYKTQKSNDLKAGSQTSVVSK